MSDYVNRVSLRVRLCDECRRPLYDGERCPGPHRPAPPPPPPPPPEPDFRACPLCGYTIIHHRLHTHDERFGYNIDVTVMCKGCGLEQSTSSTHDSNGWCNEEVEAVLARAVKRWNTRRRPVKRRA